MFRNYLRRTGFRRQLTIAITTAILGLALFSSLMTSWKASQSIRSYMLLQGQRISENLARQSTLALLYHSADNARDSVATTLAFPDVTQVTITDASHKTLLSQTRYKAKTSESTLPQFPKLDKTVSHGSLIQETNEEWSFSSPVYSSQTESTPFDVQDRPQPQILGYVHITLGKSTLHHLISALLVGNLIITFSFAAVLLSIMRLLARHMLQPLHALSDLMLRAESGESGIRATPDGPRDIIDMAKAFNKMMDVLEDRETELKKSRDAALHLAQMKAQFASMVSHEVRTPLNGIMGMLDIVRATPLSKHQKECIDIAWKSSHSLVDLINNILDFSKMEAGKLGLETISFSLKALIEDLIQLFSLQLQQKELKLSFSIAPDTPDLIKCDSLRLRQVLMNLIGNALKFTEQGKITISISTSEASSSAMPRLRFEVRDTGIGMSHDATRRVFESFAQADSSTTRKYGGTGLGLAICKQLVELMDGEIGVISEPGQGTTFWFTLSYIPADADNNLIDATTHPTPSATQEFLIEAPSTSLQKRRVLVAEDNRTNQIVAAGMLTISGYDHELAANGLEAIEAIRQDRFDLILMDCSMPEMDGYEATTNIRAFEKPLGRHTPIIAMTANAQPGDAEKCYAAGMDDYLAKPILLADLQHKLEYWVAQTATNHPLEHTNRANEDFPLDHTIFDKLKEILGPTLQQAIIPFLEDTPSYILQLEYAAHNKDANIAQAMAHAIKGSSLNLGAKALAKYAKEIEELALNHRFDSILSKLPQLHKAFEIVNTVLGAEISTEKTIDIPTSDEVIQVMIVDDDRSTRNSLRYTLQLHGFRVEEAGDGEQALTMLKCFQPDIILMDALMPVMDGFTACTRIQELPHGKTIPVLMITALEDTLSVERAFAVGASDYITKPIHFATLSQRLHRIIDAHKTEKQVNHLAYNDLLTGLPNRTMFFKQLEHTIEQAKLTDKTVATLFLDINRFKNVNDTLGHNIGDRLLVAVAQRLRHSIRSTDFIARLGSDEFTIILPDLADPAAAAAAAQNIERSLTSPIRIDEHDIFVTASMGISLYPDDSDNAADLLKHADTAMYRAKISNTDFQFFKPEMEQSITERNRLESDLRSALARNEFMLFYQPQADMATGRIVGVEALIRWIHPTRGFVSPMEFIPLAEEVGLIVPIGEWVLRTACIQLKEWMQSGLPPFRMSVNVSVRQLLEKDFAHMVEQTLAHTQLPPHLLELEITESTLMENAQDTLAVLHEIRKLGVRMSIDDFGTGYSSLAYLRQFPIDIIKIDRSFTLDIPQDTDASAIVTAIMVLAHSLRLEVVAEGVETESQLRFLQEQHCNILQGYYLSKPVPADKLNHAFFSKHHFQPEPPLAPNTH